VIVTDQLAILTPGKCGSTVLHKTLCEQHNLAAYAINFQGSGLGNLDYFQKHTMIVPPWVKEVYIVVRNPYKRLGSLWRHACAFWFKGTLEEYVAQVVEPRDPTLWFYWWTINDYNPPPAVPIRLENLGQWVKERFGVELVDERRTQVELSRELIERVREWARPDCERWGYSATRI
jgi:hypothetical protein